ncbi:helicase-related protein [Endozoicomonas ascidiicola]|uniref:helicase-related protein n=1 Tax=Endozoicomonas ascidiicola TaxID=1698521 RepID=UPI000832539A|nr:helicase-related protein [Endozoicomonas ascidiicola]
MDYQNQRNRLVDWIRSQLTGNLKDGEHLVGSSPLDRYFTGILFPLSQYEDIEENTSDGDDSNEAQPIRTSKRYQPPCSAGMSFFITGKKILLRVYYSACSFSPEKKFNYGHIYNWVKNDLATNDGEEISFENPNQLTGVHSETREVLNSRGKINILWRPHGSGYIVTLSLTNAENISDSTSSEASNKSPEKFKTEQCQKALFNVEFKCIIEEGELLPYPAKNRLLLTEEEQELELRYKDNKVYAIGHGVAVDWRENQLRKMEINSDFMPTVEVPQVTANTSGPHSHALSFSFLSNMDNKSEITRELEGFIQDYSQWIDSQSDIATNEAPDDHDTANRILHKITIARDRMNTGLNILKSNHEAFLAFAIANQAMLKQMTSTKKGNFEFSNYKWRPFQLAFVLMVMESAINENSDFRDIVDLIWFPTGGGKTEAYLGVMAFLFAYRRITAPASANGTMAIMRYTLRLLTAQQFTRACKVISALELIRRKDTSILGNTPISIGLWVGDASSPNSYKQAITAHQEQKFSQFVVNACPWCGDKFTDKNYFVRDNDFKFKCMNDQCDFGSAENNQLPYQVVDEALYEKPPTLLIATVDKFARLAWEERASIFFGGQQNKPPELIIQDELHLISGALGSIVGIYELGIDALLTQRGVTPKYIASTATIRNADKQVKTLFARDMAVFPPAGLRYQDSYFARTIPLSEKPGRLYLGYLAFNLPKNKSLAPLAGLLLSAPMALFRYEEEFKDCWWTQLIYHGSLKGVANSRSVYQSSADKFFKLFASEQLYHELEGEIPGIMGGKLPSEEDDFLKKVESHHALTENVKSYFPLRNAKIETITSQKSAEENAHVFDALTLNYEQNNAIDVALATNMVSVGLDVSRLALMVINGQPLTTAEYIQASSRVGRGEVPGIVITNYYKNQARSLSHYENFRSYHDSFYKYVEPSSLTPFTFQVRKRALHAAIILAARHSNIGLLGNDTASDFDLNSTVIKALIDTIKIRASKAIGDQGVESKVYSHIDQIVMEWQAHVERAKSERQSLRYSSKDRSYQSLIYRFGDDKKPGAWPTLDSMRNVENSALIKHTKNVKL